MQKILTPCHIVARYEDICQLKNDESLDGPATFAKFQDMVTEDVGPLSSRAKNKLLGQLFAAALVQQTAMDSLIESHDGQRWESDVVTAGSVLTCQDIRHGGRSIFWWITLDEASLRDE